MRGNSLKLHQERFKLDIKKNVFMERIVKHWKRLHGEVMESSSLEELKKVSVWNLRTWFNGEHDGVQHWVLDYFLRDFCCP